MKLGGPVRQDKEVTPVVLDHKESAEKLVQLVKGVKEVLLERQVDLDPPDLQALVVNAEKQDSQDRQEPQEVQVNLVHRASEEREDQPVDLDPKAHLDLQDLLVKLDLEERLENAVPQAKPDNLDLMVHNCSFYSISLIRQTI